MFTLGLMNIHQLISIPRTNLTWVCSPYFGEDHTRISVWGLVTTSSEKPWEQMGSYTHGLYVWMRFVLIWKLFLQLIYFYFIFIYLF